MSHNYDNYVGQAIRYYGTHKGISAILSIQLVKLEFENSLSLTHTSVYISHTEPACIYINYLEKQI